MKPGRRSPAKGKPIACSVCGWSVFTFLFDTGRRPNQSMHKEGDGYVHVDKKVCALLAKKEKVGKYRRDRDEDAGTPLPEDAIGGPSDVAGEDGLHLPGEVGLDSGYDEPAGA